MRLFIAIGYLAKNALPELVYLGRDGTAYEAACKAAPFPLIEKFPNPRGIRKNNGAAAANAADEEAAFLAEQAAAQAEYNSAVLTKAGELAAERDAKIQELFTRLDRADQSRVEAANRADKAEADLAKLRADVEGAERGHAAALAERDAEVTSLRAALKAANKKGGAAPPADPSAC